MAIHIFDTSAIGKHYHAETGTAKVDALCFSAAWPDGTIRMFSADMPESNMRALIERNDGKAVELPDS